MMLLSTLKMGRPVVSNWHHHHDLVDTLLSLVGFTLALFGLISFHRLSLKKARQLSDQFNWVVEELPVISWMSDPEGRVLYMNQHWADLHDGEKGKALGHGWINIVHDDDVAEVRQLLDSGIRAGSSIKFQTRFKVQSGVRWFQIRLYPIKNDQGEIVRWFGQAIDIDDYCRIFDKCHEPEH